ncbi:MAG: PadR family transcriptional regulator [Gemmatimonadota bacterium]|jgi:transcriptional regulator
MRVELVQGTLDMLILKALSGEARHGYGVARWLEAATDDALRVEEGSLYPALHRLAERGWVEAEWGFSENNRKARYYRLTAEGRKQLRQERASWGRFVEVVTKVMSA